MNNIVSLGVSHYNSSFSHLGWNVNFKEDNPICVCLCVYIYIYIYIYILFFFVFFFFLVFLFFILKIPSKSMVTSYTRLCQINLKLLPRIPLSMNRLSGTLLRPRLHSVYIFHFVG
jgi:hypothetical protein